MAARQHKIYGSIAWDLHGDQKKKRKKRTQRKYLTICVIFMLLQIVNICFKYTNSI